MYTKITFIKCIPRYDFIVRVCVNTIHDLFCRLKALNQKSSSCQNLGVYGVVLHKTGTLKVGNNICST